MASHVVLVVKNLAASAEDRRTRVPSLGQKDPLEEEMTTPSSTLAWRIPWTEEPGGLWFIGSGSWRRVKPLSMHARGM